MPYRRIHPCLCVRIHRLNSQIVLNQIFYCKLHIVVLIHSPASPFISAPQFGQKLSISKKYASLKSHIQNNDNNNPLFYLLFLSIPHAFALPFRTHTQALVPCLAQLSAVYQLLTEHQSYSNRSANEYLCHLRLSLTYPHLLTAFFFTPRFSSLSSHGLPVRISPFHALVTVVRTLPPVRIFLDDTTVVLVQRTICNSVCLPYRNVTVELCFPSFDRNALPRPTASSARIRFRTSPT